MPERKPDSLLGVSSLIGTAGIKDAAPVKRRADAQRRDTSMFRMMGWRSPKSNRLSLYNYRREAIAELLLLRISIDDYH